MSKVLVIKGASFENNSVATISFIDPVPCTGITLSKQSTTFSDVGLTETITATVTPTDTTDTVIWTSSNTSVVTVSNGVLSSVGVGSSVITAKCGTKTATCTVEVESLLTIYKKYSNFLNASSTTMRECTTISSKQNYLTVCKDSGVYPISYNTLGVDADSCYPISIPNGSTKVKITCPNLGILYTLHKKDSVGTVVTSGRTHAKALDGIIATSGTPWSISTWTVGYMEIDLSTKSSEVNSISFSLYNESSDVITNYDTTKIKVEFE